MEQNGMYQVVQQEAGPQADTAAKQEIEDPSTEYQEEEEDDADALVKEDGDDDDYTPMAAKGKSELSAGQFDTTDVFSDVFGDRREFDSWDGFTDYLEDFQTKSGTRYKPRSACRVDHVNERRIGSPIPERFVYAAIKMICVHYGEGGSGKRKSYVGKGCEAFMRVSYSKGAMRITQTHLIHNNHDPIFENNHPHTRNFKVFNFTEELDLVMVKEVLRANPFEFKNGEKEWTEAVDKLKNGDTRFSSITPRLVKKRTRLLLDNFTAISQGKKPSSDDEMGSILFKLDKAKKNVSVDTPFSSFAKNRKRRGRGRPRKVSFSEEENDFLEDNDDLVSYIPAHKKSKTKPSPVGATPSSTKSVSNGEISLLLSYLQKKDEEDRRLRHKELEEDRRLKQRELEEDRKLRLKEHEEDRRLRQREMDLRRDELKHQKERFEFEKIERKAHMDLLKSQLQVFEQSMVMKQQQPQPQPLPQPQPQAPTLMPLTLAQPLPQQQPQQPPQQQQPRDNRQPQATDYNQFHYR